MELMELSTDLDQIELEIQHHKNIAGQSIWEIGRRLNHVKKNNLTHGEFTDWVERNLEIKYRQANKFMKIASEFSNMQSTAELGIEALYMIATLPEEEREKEHELESGETKAVDEMTVRELKEVKRKNREQKERIKELENQKPKVVEKEIVPHDYGGLKSDNQQLESNNRKLRTQLEELEAGNSRTRREYNDLVKEMKQTDEKSKRYDELNEAMKEMNGRLNEGQRQLKAQKEIYELIRKSEKVIEELAPLSYLIDADSIIDNDYAQQPIERIANNLDEISNRLRNTLEGITIIEG